ncbi:MULTISPECIES: sensor histidine kinase [unclassified Curtobacterium]|uniref:sensor histidine kinase n=1 Tax=unclassified Curtobacterium TaxID=257496 RepID=UPI001E4E9410|nr:MULTISPECIES: HAMP domain-containing sensor histidine kinase [unclassified Curtobacterium]MCY1692925.1 HAMP domain-containing sensor histidine kinase [Curtobacterium sp. SL109]
MRSLSIRTRITLGSLLIGAIVLAAVAVVLHLQIRAQTRSTEVSLATSDIAPFLADLRNHPDEQPDAPSAGVLVAVQSPDGSFLVDTLPHDVRRGLPGSSDVDGTRTGPGQHRGEPGDGPGTRNREGGPADGVPVGLSTTDGRTTYRTQADGAVFSVVGERLSTADGTFRVWAARNGAAGELTLAAVDRSLVIGTVLALAAFAGTAWLLTSLALRPVARMRRAAEDLSTGDADGDLPVGRTDDEIADLATTLNAFLQRQRASAEHERRMVSDASHELRTPLAVLTNRLELAHRSFGDAEALERDVRSIETDVHRLTALTATLLELSRLDETAPSTVTVAPTTASDLVSELMAAIDRGRAGTGDAAVGVDFDLEVSDPEATYAVSAAAFGRVLDNLVTNATTFSPEGGSVRVHLAQRADTALVLTVTDDGPGVPASFIPVAFDRFTRADESRRRVRGGSGLGLSLVRAIAMSAGGSTELANAPGGGAVATVMLPRT